MILQLISLVITGLPLLIYPGILMAGVMGLAAQPRQGADQLILAVSRAFLVLSLLYPITFGVGTALLASGFERLGHIVLWGNLLLCLGLFGWWYALSIP